MSDPTSIPGLAHFNEHMLFLGTKQYPVENSFSQFLSSSGGSSNAFTDSEHTNFYFDTSSSQFPQALERFATFFSSALLSESGVSRELNAIESEHSKNLQNDNFRAYQLEKSRANPNHPFSKFYTGNKATLQTSTIRADLKSFYERYYTAEQMFVAVVSPTPLSLMTPYATKLFSQIPNRGGKNHLYDPPETAWNFFVPPFLAPPNLLKTVPINPTRSLSLHFPLVYKDVIEKRQIQLLKPFAYLGHLIGHEGPESLLSFLKSCDVASGVAVYTSNDLSDFSTFEVDFELTKKGIKDWEFVVKAAFSFLDMLTKELKNSDSDFIFNECIQTSDIAFRFYDPPRPGGAASPLAGSLKTWEFAPNLVVAGSMRLGLGDGLQGARKTVDKVLQSTMRPSNALFTLCASKSELNEGGKKFDREKIYSTEYRTSQISVESWDYQGGRSRFSLPARNSYIPTDAGLRFKGRGTLKERKMKDFSSPPTKLKKTSSDNFCFFKQDIESYGTPRAYCVFEILTNEAYKSAETAAVATVYNALVGEFCDEAFYDARVAGLSATFAVVPRGVRFTFGGYNEKIMQFAQDFVEIVRRGEFLRSDKAISRNLDLCVRSAAGFDTKEPYALCSYYTELLVTPEQYKFAQLDVREKLENTVTKSKLMNFHEKIHRGGKLLGLVQGNLVEAEAEEIVKSLGNYHDHDHEEEYKPPLEALSLPPGIQTTAIKLDKLNKNNVNEAVQVSLQSSVNSERDAITANLMAAVIEQKFYDDLRTKQQLGYICSSGLKRVGAKSLLLSFIVQSSDFNSAKLASAVDVFLVGMRQNVMDSMTEDDVKLLCEELSVRVLEPEANLASEASRHWGEIISEEYKFGRILDQVKELKTITKADLSEWWRKVYEDAEGRRMLVVEITDRKGGGGGADDVNALRKHLQT